MTGGLLGQPFGSPDSLAETANTFRDGVEVEVKDRKCHLKAHKGYLCCERGSGFSCGFGYMTGKRENAGQLGRELAKEHGLVEHA
jgi:hypothetical protein